MKLFILVLGLVLAPVSGSAIEPDRLSFTFGSMHLNATSEFNEFNPGVFLTWENERKYHLGAYWNSYEKVSVAALVGWPIIGDENWTFDIIAGGAYYPGDGRDFPVSLGDFVPLAGVQLRTGRFFAQVFPGDGDIVDAIISFGVTIPIEDFQR